MCVTTLPQSIANGSEGGRAARSARRGPCSRSSRAAPSLIPTSRSRRRTPRACRGAAARRGSARATRRPGHPPPSASPARGGSAHVARDDEAGADVPGDRDRHEADGAAARDEHADDREREGGAPRCRTGRRSRRPRVRPAKGAPTRSRRDHDELGERTIPVQADALGADAHSAAPGGAVAQGGACRRRCGPRPTRGRRSRRRGRTRPPRRPRRRTRDPGSAGADLDEHQSSHCSMCRSVLQMPVRSTRIFTSAGPVSGSGRSTNSNPRAGRGLVQGLHRRCAFFVRAAGWGRRRLRAPRVTARVEVTRSS